MKSKYRQFVENIPLWKKIAVRRQIDLSIQIVDILKQKGLTQKQLAEKAEWQPSFVTRILSGEQNLTLETIAKIEAVLGEQLLVIPMFSDESKILEVYDKVSISVDTNGSPIHSEEVPCMPTANFNTKQVLAELASTP